jgi:hypothetical protein
LLKRLKKISSNKKTEKKAKKEIKKFLESCINKKLLISDKEYDRLMSPVGIGPNFSTNSFIKT